MRVLTLVGWESLVKERAALSRLVPWCWQGDIWLAVDDG